MHYIDNKFCVQRYNIHALRSDFSIYTTLYTVYTFCLQNRSGFGLFTIQYSPSYNIK